MADDGYMLSRSALRRVQAAVKWVESFRRSPDNVRRRVPRGGGGTSGFYAILTANSSHVTNWTWTYSWAEVEKTGIGYGNWTTKSGGMFGTSAVASGGAYSAVGLDLGPAYNTIENMNGASGLVGAGVDVDGIDTDYFTFAFKEIPIGAIVWMRPVSCVVDDVDVTEYWFSAWNAVDGSCD